MSAVAREIDGHAPLRAVVPETAPAAAPRGPVDDLFEQAARYQADRWQRMVLFLDTLRERANNMFAHEAAGLPPLLNFEYETVLDARDFDRPANYALLRIVRYRNEPVMECVDDRRAPVIIFDPRAGHGPGIGGFKRESEVGMALHEGHPTYFVIFFPQPDPNQTLGDVLHAMRRFVAEVSRRHGGAAPVLYGNCQAGWAVAMLAADCAGVSGPVVMNGSPLSYWAGASGVNPMRLAGGLLGGSWLAHWMADLGNGLFDGAWLVQNFENLNPAHAVWAKYYALFAHVDTERERFLEFERWWTGYYSLSRPEILSIIQNLFIGNQLERGLLKLCDGCYVDLTRIRAPLIVFASSADNITPPHQALNWIPTVYPTTRDLKQADQRIVYLLNQHVGHLGIFVSANVAQREHRAILENLGAIEGLAPGLYEMRIEGSTGESDCLRPQYVVRFEEREVEQIRYEHPRESFERVQALSAWNEFWYGTVASPWVRALATPLSAEMMKWCHPLRVATALYSERTTPAMAMIGALAATVKLSRTPLEEDNAFAEAEGSLADAVSAALDSYRRLRDAANELFFKILYGPS